MTCGSARPRLASVGDTFCVTRDMAVIHGSQEVERLWRERRPPRGTVAERLHGSSACREGGADATGPEVDRHLLAPMLAATSVSAQPRQSSNQGRTSMPPLDVPSYKRLARLFDPDLRRGFSLKGSGGWPHWMGYLMNLGGHGRVLLRKTFTRACSGGSTSCSNHGFRRNQMLLRGLGWGRGSMLGQ